MIALIVRICSANYYPGFCDGMIFLFPATPIPLLFKEPDVAMRLKVIGCPSRAAI